MCYQAHYHWGARHLPSLGTVGRGSWGIYTPAHQSRLGYKFPGTCSLPQRRQPEEALGKKSQETEWGFLERECVG